MGGGGQNPFSIHASVVIHIDPYWTAQELRMPAQELKRTHNSPCGCYTGQMLGNLNPTCVLHVVWTACLGLWKVLYTCHMIWHHCFVSWQCYPFMSSGSRNVSIHNTVIGKSLEMLQLKSWYIAPWMFMTTLTYREALRTFEKACQTLNISRFEKKGSHGLLLFLNALLQIAVRANFNF